MASPFPEDHSLRREGLDALLAGRPIEAEQFFRKALAVSDPEGAIRSRVCLADALMDQGRYEETMSYLVRAIEDGDRTGSAQCSMADLLLLTKADPEKALAMAASGMELVTGSSGPSLETPGAITSDLKHAIFWARSAEALAQLNRRHEAAQAIERAVHTVEAASAQHGTSGIPTSLLFRLLAGQRINHVQKLFLTKAHFKIGLALLAVDQPAQAVFHFKAAVSADPLGKYRMKAQRELNILSKPIVNVSSAVH